MAGDSNSGSVMRQLASQSLHRGLIVAFAITASAVLLETPVFAASGDERELAAALMGPDQGQKLGNLVARLARERNLAALDILLASKNAAQVEWYVRNFREPLRGEPSPELEERLVVHYQEPALAVALMGSMGRYQSAALADKLIADVEQYAGYWSERMKQCRIVASRARRRPDVGSISFNTFGKPLPSKQYSELDCSRANTADAAQLSRWSAAVASVGNTELNGIAARTVSYISRLSAMPEVDPAARAAVNASPALAAISNLRSIVTAIERERYDRAVPRLVAAVHQLDGRSGEEYAAVWPVLQTLARLHSPEAFPEIERWIELRAAQSYRLGGEPSLGAMIGLLSLAPADGPRMIALRNRVLAEVPYASLREVSSAFRALPAIGANAPPVPY